MACGSRKSAPHILNLDTRQKWWLSCPRERAHSIQRLNGPQNWSGCFGLKKDALANNRTQIMWWPAHSLVTSPCIINACKINKESKNTCQTTKLSSFPPPLSGTSLQGIYRPLVLYMFHLLHMLMLQSTHSCSCVDVNIYHIRTFYEGWNIWNYTNPELMYFSISHRNMNYSTNSSHVPST